MKKIIFFLKNPGIHEKMDVFWINLRGYPTISISCSGTVKIKATTIEVDILKEIINAGTTWYHKGRVMFMAEAPEG